MKKVIPFLVFTVLLGLCTGCQKQETKRDEETLTVCVDSWFSDLARELIDTWEAMNEGVRAELVVIPRDSDAGEIEIAKIRTEIMSGGGPDIFILSCMDPTSTNSAPILFSNPEKTMYSDIFLILDEYIAQAEYMKTENLNEIILEAGRTEEGQVLLPICYHYSAYAFRAEDVEAEDIPSSWEELRICENPTIQRKMQIALHSYFYEIFGTLADYKEEKLLFSEEELLTKAREAAQYIEMSYETKDVGNAPEAVAGGEVLTSFCEHLVEEQGEHRIFGFPNEDGGITANITMYAAVNRNTQQPEKAFSLLDVFFSDEIMGGTGFKNEKHTLEPLNLTALQDASINRQALQNMYASLSQKDAELMESMDGRINAVRFYSDLDKEIYEMFYQYVRTHDQSERKEIVHKTYDNLRMELAE